MKDSGAEKPSVLVVDDHPIVRHGLAQLLKQSRRFRVFGEAGDPREALAKMESAAPDLLLIDLFLQGQIALDTIRHLRESHPELGILVISMQNEAYYAQKALDAGADGYIVKEEASDRILQALQRVRERKTYISYPVLKKLLYHYAEDRKSSGVDAVLRLSEREFQVFRMMGEGHGTRHIAEELGLGIKSVETYCARIKKKLDLRNATELLRHAIQWRGP